MATKAEFMKALDKLPDDATIEDAVDRLYVLYKTEQGIADLDAGRVISEAELTERVNNRATSTIIWSERAAGTLRRSTTSSPRIP